VSYRVELAPRVEKDLASIPESTRRRVKDCIDTLARKPRPAGTVKMKGLRNIWRLRVGAWRVVYEIRDDVLIVLVLRVAHRREVYRRLS
jgi:mRNA interferase RelE/StbE